MHDKELTKKILGDVGPLRFNPYVIKICQGCGISEKRRYKGFGKPSDPYYCTKCIANRPEKRIASSAGAKKGWTDSDYREKMVEHLDKLREDPEVKEKMHQASIAGIPALIQRNKEMAHNPIWIQSISSSMKKTWENPEYRTRVIKHMSITTKLLWSNPIYREKIISASTELWNNIEYRQKVIKALTNNWEVNRQNLISIFSSQEFRQKMSEVNKKVWNDSVYRERILKERKDRWENDIDYRKMIEAALLKGRTHMCRVSSLQTTLYSMLDDLGVKYYRERLDAPTDKECIIGPYTFDCAIPRINRPTLLIECQGEYWHSQEKAIRNDQSKASYITNNFSNQYELKYIWEHEFSFKDRISSLLRYWLGIEQPNAIDFNFESIQIKESPANDYRLLLSKYHYLANAGRGGICYGAYLNNQLVAICVFSPLVRQNLPYDENITRELSRLCIHPAYQKHNFASWFVSRCMKLLDPKYTIILSYCDTTFNHDGAIYKACNFILDGKVPPDYWYVREDGWVIHKRAVYRHATRMHMTESQYVELWGYKKIYGLEKLRFIFKR